jgi:hypothetical protein
MNGYITVTYKIIPNDKDEVKLRELIENRLTDLPSKGDRIISDCRWSDLGDVEIEIEDLGEIAEVCVDNYPKPPL